MPRKRANGEISGVMAAGNRLLRGVAYPAPSKPNIDAHELMPQDPASIDHANKQAPLDILYPLYEILQQQQPHNCGDTCSMMILDFHRQNLEALLADKELEEAAPKVREQIAGTSKVIDKYEKKPKIYKGFEMPGDDLPKLYGVGTLEIQHSKKDPQAFAQELAYHLYTRGPLQIQIKTKSYRVSTHEILLLGIVGKDVIYADPWDAQQKSLPIESFAKKFSDPRNLVMRIAVEGYSYAFLNGINQLKEAKRNAQPPENRNAQPPENNENVAANYRDEIDRLKNGDEPSDQNRPKGPTIYWV